MKKILDFFCNTKKGQGIMLGCAVAVLITSVIGLILSLPIFWIGGREYQATWMNSVAPYFFIPAAVFFLFLLVPHLSFLAYSGKYEGNGQSLVKGASIFGSIVSGEITYVFIAKALFIPIGLHDLAGMLLCGLLYLWMMKIIFRKPFATVQTFIPLC